MRDRLLVCAVVLVFSMGWSFFAPTAVAGVGANPSSVNFGSVNVNTNSAVSVIVVTNNYRRAMTIEQVSSSLSAFSVTGPALPLTLQSHQSASFAVVFKPTVGSVLSANIEFTVVHRYTSTLVVPVTGTGVAVPTSTYLLSPSSTSVSFPNTLVGSSTSQVVTLSNLGNSSVNISQVSVSGTGFLASGLTVPATLSAGQSVSFNVAFSPGSAGASSGSVTVLSNATNSPSTISLSATGVQPQIAVVPTSVSFGNVSVGVANTQTITVKNPGTANLTVTQATLSGTGYSANGVSLPLTIAAGGSAAFTLSFAPTAATTATGVLTLISNAPTPSVAVALSGTGIAQVMQLSASPASLNFGSLALQTSASQTVALTNTGNSSVSISQVNVAGAWFSYSGITLPITLAAGQSTSFNVIFDPTTTGSLSGSATVVSNATNSPTTIALSGTGAAVATHSVNLSWQPSTSSVVGYYVYGGLQSGGPYTKMNSSPIASTTYSDNQVVAGDTYYFVTTAVDSSGQESAYSNQVMATIP